MRMDELDVNILIIRRFFQKSNYIPDVLADVSVVALVVLSVASWVDEMVDS